MGPVFYVMAILGCGEADTACQQVGVAQAQYATVEECNAATGNEVEQRMDLAYPVIVAQCHRADQKVSLQLDSDDVMLPEPDAVPRALRNPSKVQMAARR